MKYLPLLLILPILFLLLSCDEILGPKEKNRPPVIVSITSTPATSSTNRIRGSSSIQITVVATDPDKDKLSYSWSANDGKFESNTEKASIRWISPISSSEQEYRINVTVTDGIDKVEGTIIIYVKKTVAPVVATSEITEITSTSIRAGGEVIDDGSSEITARGIVWRTDENPTINDNKTIDGSGIGIFMSNITGLQEETTYYIRAYAINSMGTAYGTQKIVSTHGLPKIITSSISNIRGVWARGGGEVIDDGGTNVLIRGVVWSTSEYPTLDNSKTYDGNGTGGFSSYMTNLRTETIYYVRAYATNSVGTGYGEQVYFKTEGVTDIDGNVYETVNIGQQRWMAENLRTSKYRNGNIIPSQLEDLEWADAEYGAYSIYPHSQISILRSDAEVAAAYGKLYNWYAVDDARGLCPKGWHVPSDEEWITLINYLGGSSIAGGKMKSIISYGYNHPRWNSPNIDATNESGFSGYPGGRRLNNGSFRDLGSYGLWWSSSETNQDIALHQLLWRGVGESYRVSAYKNNGFSVRCIKD